jgi:aminocarboxymuconate-semialdehyde decarboxylase
MTMVVTALAFGGLAMAAGLSSESLLPPGTVDVMRKHVLIDTMRFHPALIRASVDLLGADKVMAGSDWADRP